MPSVMVVDDDRDVRESLVLTLEDAGYRTHQAANGRQALEKLALHTPDVLLVDVMMPVMSGMELLRALRADAQLRHIPVILMTGINDSMIGVRLNAPVVTKPHFDALMPILRQYVRAGGNSAAEPPRPAGTDRPLSRYLG